MYTSPGHRIPAALTCKLKSQMKGQAMGTARLGICELAQHGPGLGERMPLALRVGDADPG
eukprot:10671863-Lingulodinium_polyedra.AAC.1